MNFEPKQALEQSGWSKFIDSFDIIWSVIFKYFIETHNYNEATSPDNPDRARWIKTVNNEMGSL